MEYLDIEGGFFGVVSDEGYKFIPLDLPEKFRVNGTLVSFSFRTVPDAVSFSMWGEQVEVISMQALSPVNTTRQSLPLVDYERAGGVSGAYESMSIYPDGKGEVSKWNLVEQISLDQDEIDNLTRATNISGFSDLKSEYMPSGPVPDAVTYTITLQNKSIKTTAKEAPMEIKPLLLILNKILDENSISPVKANMTLEGTAWRLSSFTRPDGIPVILPHNSQISAVFEKENLINGSTGCSPYSTSYNQSGTNLSFSPVRMTRMACMEPGAGDVESAFVELLGKVSMVAGQQQKLIMTDMNNTTLLVFDQVQRNSPLT